MKKVLVILLLLPLLCGCEAEYKLTIKGNNISEELNVRESQININNSINNTTYKKLFDDNFVVETQISMEEPKYLDDAGTINPDAKFYNKSIINDENYYGISLNYDFSYNDFKEDYIINACPEHINFLSDGSSIIINTRSISACFNKFEYLDKIIINIDIKNKVINSNATSVDGNIYKWEINRGYDGIIYIEYKSNLSTANENPKEENNNSIFSKTDWIILIIVLLGLIFAGLFVFNSIMGKNRANNKL